MDNVKIKKMVEEKVKVSDNKFENRVELTFETKNSNDLAKITLSGEGSLKVLMPV